MKKRAYKLQRFADGDVVTHTLNTKTQLYKTLYGIHKYLNETHAAYGVSTLWHRPTVSSYIADNRKVLGLPACKKRSVLMNRIGANMTHLFNLAFIGRGKDGRYRLLSEWTEEKTNEPIVKILQEGVRGKMTKEKAIAKAITEVRAKNKTKIKAKVKNKAKAKAKAIAKAITEVRAKAKAKEATVMVVTRLPVISELTGETTLLKEEHPVKELVKIFESRITGMSKNDRLLVKIEKERLVIGIPLLKNCNGAHEPEGLRVLTGLDAVSAFVGTTPYKSESYPIHALVSSFERILKKMPYENGIILEIKEGSLTFSVALEDKELSDLMLDK